ncbi:hypothetical protein CspeluHIS016_0103600 [Cutaneotrichosporon spelunceum]|uniref:Ankyrin n=1 Tax=Cutaneotrichosporon spelunceum TaxID=1672016 RepID=A0AAD3TNI5_9TREE|nr:hypothetical protein CspeluHIS016_0103600 [Cutaneotrichosporon spelunceum]
MTSPSVVPTPNKRSLHLPKSCILVPSNRAITRARPSAKFMDLPLEIFQSIHMYSGSESLPVVNKYLQSRFSNVYYKARWVLYKQCPTKDQLCNTYTNKSGASQLDIILTRRLCDKEVLLRVLEIWENQLRQYEREERAKQLELWEREKEQERQRCWSSPNPEETPPEPEPPYPSPRATRIPRRLLRTRPGTQPRLDPYVRFLVGRFQILPDADGCYPLLRGAADRNYELIQWLIQLGASVTTNESIAFKAAIVNQDLKMMRLLMQPDEKKYGKKRQLTVTNRVPLFCRMPCARQWVDLALQHKAYDIVRWLVDEKGLTPSLKGIMNLESAGYNCFEQEHPQEKAPRQEQRRKNKKRKL